MTWYICLIIALGILVSAGFYAFNNKKRKLDYAFIMLMCAGFFSYFPHYIANYDVFNAILCDIVNLFQIVTLNSNTYETYQPEITNPFWFYLCIWIRGVLHVTSPFLGTVAAYNFIRTQLEKWRAKSICRNKTEIFVFSSYNDKAIRIAESIADNSEINHKKISFIFYDAEKEDSNLEEKLRYKGVANIRRKMKMDAETVYFPGLNLKNQNVYFFLVEDSDENLNKGILLNNSCNDMVRGEKITEKDLTNIHITLLSNHPVQDEKIIDSIATNIDLRVINEERTFVYNLLNDLPLYKASGKEISVLIVGFGNIGREFLFAALALGQMPGKKIKFNILSENAEDDIEYLNYYYPELISNYNIHFHKTRIDSSQVNENISKYAADANYIVVCRNNDSDNINTAIMLRKYFLASLSKKNDFSNMPFIAVHISKNAKADSIKESNYKLFPFGYENQIYTYSEMVNSELEALAKRVHFAYCNTTKEKIAEDIRDYYKYERNRRASISFALSIKYKLDFLGFELSKEDNGCDDFEMLKECINNCELNDISEAEHRRWMAYMRTEGYTHATAEQAVGFKMSPYSDIISNKNGQSIFMSMHMDICDMDKITPLTKMFNDIMKKYNPEETKKDTTDTDKFIIKKIPEILSNEEWNSEAKLPHYYIRKL